jgi:hypothetical protein
MHSDPENRVSPIQGRSKSYWGWVAAAAILIVGVYFFSSGQSPTEEVPLAEAPPAQTSMPEPELELPPAPDIPQKPEPATVTVNVEPAQPPATLETSDQELRNSLSSQNSSVLLDTALANENLIERSVSVVDGLSRGGLPFKALPISPPSEKFSVRTVDGTDFMNTESYHRYDSYAQTIGELDTQTLTSNFNRFRPLLEQAYADLGYPAQDFDNALIRTLDRVLATPQLREPIALKKKESVYIYADTRIEQLTQMQKLLLRMGPDNIALIQAQAKDLREALLGTAPKE